MITKYSEYIRENSSNSHFFKTYEETKEWLDKMEIKNYKINDDLTVDVSNGVNLSNRKLSYIPVKFGIVNGGFWCNNNKLKTLVGSPEKVLYSFDCSNNKLSSLIGSPKQVKGGFYNDIDLTSIDGYSIYNLKININKDWYKLLNSKIKEDYFDKNLEENPEIISLINFETSKEFKNKWNHLFNASKFDLI